MKLILLSLSLGANFMLSGLAQEKEFRYDVSDYEQSDKLDYERIQHIDIGPNDDGSVDASFIEYFYVNGVKQPEFSYAPAQYRTHIPAEAYQKFLESVGKLDPQKLEKKTKNHNFFQDGGTLEIGGKKYQVLCSHDSAERKPWEDLLLGLRKQFPPSAKEQEARIILQGDFLKPVDLGFDDLVKSPEHYAGKRVKVLGFYHCEFECSAFSRTKETSPGAENALWLGNYSSFVDSDKLPKINDAFIVVEATFEPHNQGHMGAYQGALSRITAIREATDKETQVQERGATD